MAEAAAPEMTALEVQKVLAELAAKDARARNAGLPPGQALYEQEIAPGATIQREQRRGLITMDGQPLPDRVTIWERLTGYEKRISTTLLAKKLAIRDHEGGQRFVTEKPDLPEPEFIKETCPVCRRNRGLTKRFQHKWDYYGHMETFHQREWRIIQAEEQASRPASLDAILAAIRSMTPEERQALMGGTNGHDTGTPIGGEGAGAEGVRPDDEGRIATCPDCGWKSKPVKQPGASLATHKRFHCKSAAVVGAGSGS